MIVYNIDSSFTNVPKLKERINLCLGYFDGVHIAHQRLINEATSYSNNKVGIITFTSSPKRRENLTSLEGRLALFKILNVDYVFVFKFNNRLKNTTADTFKSKFLDVINPYAIICGDDFAFGKMRKGNVDFLKEFYKVEIVPFVKKDNKKVSSFDIANLIKNGKIDKANILLGRRYTIKGRVISGYHHGRDLDFPTANVKITDNYVVPKYGVYIVLIYINGIPHLGIANVGVHPTINKLSIPIVEVNIKDFNSNIYRKYVYIEFVRFIRAEKKFANEKALVNQIRKDKKVLDKIIL